MTKTFSHVGCGPARVNPVTHQTGRCCINRKFVATLANRHDVYDFQPRLQPVPYKHSESRSHKCTKPKFKVANWREYNDSLRQRGDITIWFTQAAINEWRPEKTGARGRPQEYSDHAIETAILIRQVFHLPLRQTEGFMNSMTCLMSAAISIPDFSSISRRSIELPRHVDWRIIKN